MPSPRDIDLAHEAALASVGRVLRLAAWPDVPVRLNRRLRRAGRAVIEGSGPAFRRAWIELSPAYFEVYPEDLDGILVHEATHVGLAIQGLPFGHGPLFRRVCLASGGLLHGRSLPGRIYQYRCPVCATVVERRRRLSRDRWCADCVDAAHGRPGTNPFAGERALVLVGTAFGGPEPPLGPADGGQAR